MKKNEGKRSSAAATTPALGANLGVIYDWQGTNFFTDLMKQSRNGFGYAEYPTNYGFTSVILKDSAGNPTEPFSMVVKEPLRAGDAGTYRLRFRGDADVSAGEPVSVGGQSYDAGAGLTTATVTVPSEATILLFTFANLRTPSISEVQLIPEAFAEDPPTFRPEWVEHFSRFQVIRFMNWMCWWEEQAVISWASRTKTTDWTQAKPNGVAPDYIAEFARATGCDVWLSIPPRATQDYVEGFAQLLREQLAPTQKVYLEYGNELWSMGSWQGAANKTLAAADVGSGINYNTGFEPSNPDLWAFRRQANKTKLIGDTFVATFGAGSRDTRIRPVLSYQVVSPQYTMLHGMEYLKTQYPSLAVKQMIWGIAAAPHAVVSAPLPTPVTAERFLDAMDDSIDHLTTSHPRYLEEAAAYAAWYDVQFLWYEGGVGIASHADIPAPVAFEAMQHPRIKDIYLRYASTWYAFGNDNLLCWFIGGATDWSGLNIFGTPDIFGLTWTITEQNTYPIQAIDAIRASGGFEETAGNPIPGPVLTNNHVLRSSDYTVESIHGPMLADELRWYLLRSPQERQYRIRLVALKSMAPAAVEISVNGAAMSITSIPSGSGPYSGPFTYVNFRKGLNVVRLRYLTDCAGDYALLTYAV